MNSDGNISAGAGYTGVEQPKSQEIIDLLKGAFHRQAQDGTIKACALAYDIRAIPPGQTQKTDAIAVNLESPWRNVDSSNLSLQHRKQESDPWKVVGG